MYTKPMLPPSRLCINDGVLQMQDGSDVQRYLRGGPLANKEEVVIMSRAQAQRLYDEAYEGRMAKLREMVSDERFALAA